MKRKAGRRGGGSAALLPPLGPILLHAKTGGVTRCGRPVGLLAAPRAAGLSRSLGWGFFDGGGAGGNFPPAALAGRGPNGLGLGGAGAGRARGEIRRGRFPGTARATLRCDRGALSLGLPRTANLPAACRPGRDDPHQCIDLLLDSRPLLLKILKCSAQTSCNLLVIHNLGRIRKGIRAQHRFSRSPLWRGDTEVMSVVQTLRRLPSSDRRVRLEG